MNNKKYLAIIPARGGSKRLPRKNILPLAGKPLIAWTVEAAQGCEKIDTLLVSSDDQDILSIAEQFGAECLTRPAYLASDTATSFDAIVHAIESYPSYEYTILLQATSPLRTSQHIQEAIDLLEHKNADAVISVCPAEHSPLWCNVLPADASMVNFLSDDILNKRSQDLGIYYRLNGAIYICKTDRLLQNKSFFLKDNIYAYCMDKKSSVDIDDAFDFKLAQALADI